MDSLEEIEKLLRFGQTYNLAMIQYKGFKAVFNAPLPLEPEKKTSDSPPPKSIDPLFGEEGPPTFAGEDID